MHPDYRPALDAYFTAACAKGGHTPHLLREAMAWHINLEETGRMLDIAAGTSKAHLHRAKRLLQQQLEPASDAT